MQGPKNKEKQDFGDGPHFLAEKKLGGGTRQAGFCVCDNNTKELINNLLNRRDDLSIYR